jgi:hypothetical protein
MNDARHLFSFSNSLALGCSHTYGVGVEVNEAWPYLLGANNFGKSGCSADYLLRIAPELIAKYQPITMYILWPDWTRFEYIKDGKYYQSLVSDLNRIEFMESHTTEWLLNNFLEIILFTPPLPRSYLGNTLPTQAWPVFYKT